MSRISLAVNLETRDGTLTKDALLTNGVIEKGKVRKRPGLLAFSLVKTGLAQLLISFNGIKTVIGDFFNSGYTAAGTFTHATTFDPANKAANVTLGGGNLNITMTSAVSGGAKSIASFSSGVWYYETTVNVVGGCVIGFASTGQSVTFAGGFTQAVAYNVGGGVAEITGVLGLSHVPAPVVVATDVIGCLFDIDNGTASFFKNGVAIGSLSGASVPTAPIFAFAGSVLNAATNITSKFSGGFTYTPSATSTALVVGTAGLPFSGAFNGPNATTPYLFINNAEFGWTIPTSGIVTKIADVDYPGNQTPARRTVPGLVYLDTYFFTMDTKGVLYNSAPDDPTTWTALGTIVAQYENGNGMALAKTQEYLAAFKEYSVELFYDIPNLVGSPMGRVPNGVVKIGCASGTSLAEMDGQIFWISQSKEKGRSVHVMIGTQVAEVATSDVQRVLNEDNLANVYAYTVRLDGHDLYLLTLVTSGLTIAYDATSKVWSKWTSLTQTGVSPGTMTVVSENGQAAVVCQFAHNLEDGQAIAMSGWTQPEYNGIFQIQRLNSLAFAFLITGSPASPGTGTPLLFSYSESYFKFPKYTNYQGMDLLLNESDGYLYTFEPDLFQDNLSPINLVVRTSRLDGGNSRIKTMPRATLVGDKVDDIAMMRWSDDDYQTNRPYRIIDLNTDEPMLRRCGAFKRRSMEIRHIGNTDPVWEALEVEIK